MPIQYALDQTVHTQKNDEYVARVTPVGTVDLDGIVDRIVNRGSTVGRSDVVAVLYELIDVCTDLVVDGYRVNLGDLVHLYCSIKGTFASSDDRFDRSRHAIRGRAAAGRRLNDTLAHRARTRKQHLNRRRPILKRFIDLTSQIHNRQLTPGGSGLLIGAQLKFDPDAADEGLFLIDATHQARRLDVARITPSELLFTLPADLPAGTYQLEVRARVGNATTLRKGTLQIPLVVDTSL